MSELIAVGGMSLIIFVLLVAFCALLYMVFYYED
jgi:hypothetical protein